MSTEYNFRRAVSKRNGVQPQAVHGISLGNTESSSDEQQPLDLGWLFAVVQRRMGIMVAIALLLGGISGSLVLWKTKKITKFYQGGFQVLVEPITAEGRLSQLLIQSQSANFSADEVNKVGSSVEDTSMVDYPTLLRVLKSPKLLIPLLEKLQVNYGDITYAQVNNQLKINRITYAKDGKEAGTKIIEFTYQDKDPNKINSVLGTVSKYYLEYSRQERLKQTTRGMAYIDSQLPALRMRVDKLQRQLQLLRQQANLSLPDQTSKSFTDQAGGIGSQQVTIEAQLAETRKLYKNLKEQLSQGNISGVVALNPKMYETLIGQLQTLETQLAVSSTQYLEGSPPMQSLREKQQNMRRLLEKEVESTIKTVASQIQQLEARQRSLRTSENNLNKTIRNLPSVMRQYGDLERELGVATESLKVFLSKRETLKLGVGQQDTPWTIINEPSIMYDEQGQPLSVTPTNKAKNLAIALVLSILFAVAVGFLVEVLDKVFHTPEEVKWGTKLPILGVVPRSQKLKKITKQSNHRTLVKNVADDPVKNRQLQGGSSKFRADLDYSFLEAFGSLYTNLRLLSPGMSMRSLVITSAVKGDGKSTIAFYLAKTAASVGLRVLLVDADLRLPQLHLQLGLPNVRGLGDVVATDLSLNDAIQRSPEEDNLFVLTAGHNSHDPIKLLSSKKMLYLMEQFQTFFDLVIYDTPPLVGLADAHILAAQTDGTLLVVKIDRTDRSLVAKALEGLKISGASVLGTVVNGIKGSKQAWSPRPMGFEAVHNNQLPVLGNKTPDSRI
ncbi:polysaccharide biosynthesis tyrosine autokinase [Tychonema sp. BBK16]|uniref:GumC family protein n=1 Tax=Tychonema sp. BBK16 TaxID=2699888 RepID=UPI001F327974|nr:polysaccharide biosynthesis tyrosine autokinase [Tychonema sp. BBK16]MCF6374938.1 polysaccharide biosynthesis tyrosine autokinase [Tychonema sp. BBK16]